MEILLTQGQIAVVDEEDYERVNAFKWCASWNPRTKSFYALRAFRENGKRKTVFMHRYILNPPTNVLIDHVKSGNTLDNRKDNLRKANHTQNCRNSRKPSNNKTGYKGVSFALHKKKFKSCISVKGKTINLGYYDTAIEAAKVYDNAAVGYYGEFALTNFQEGRK
jgi:hypothetical protein